MEKSEPGSGPVLLFTTCMTAEQCWEEIKKSRTIGPTPFGKCAPLDGRTILLALKLTWMQNSQHDSYIVADKPSFSGSFT